MKPFEQAGTVKAEVVLAEIEAAPYWNWLNVRRLIKDSKHTASDDIILRWQDLHGADEEQFTGLDCIDTVTAEAYPILMAAIKLWATGHEVGRVIVARLPAGAQVPAHEDTGEYADWHDRYHWVIATNPDCALTCQDETLHLPAGTIWRINNHLTHSAVNAGDSDRIHVIIDARRASKWPQE